MELVLFVFLVCVDGMYYRSGESIFICRSLEKEKNHPIIKFF